VFRNQDAAEDPEEEEDENELDQSKIALRHELTEALN